MVNSFVFNSQLLVVWFNWEIIGNDVLLRRTINTSKCFWFPILLLIWDDMVFLSSLERLKESCFLALFFLFFKSRFFYLWYLN